MAVKNSMNPITLAAFDAATLLITYQPINAGGLSHPCSILRLINTSNTSVIISYDGINDHELIGPTSNVTLSFQANNQPSNYAAMMPQGTVLYARSGVAGVGIIAVAGYYQPQGA